jgi:hypothetical protein
MKKLIGFRKVILVSVFFTISTNFVNVGQLDASIWMTEMVKLLIVFLGANLSEHVASAGKAYFAEKTKKIDQDLIEAINREKK